MISPETEALILRYHHAEHWRAGTIARQLGVHHSVVARVLAKDGQAPIAGQPRARLIDAYVPFVRDTLARFPGLSAARLYQMVKARGFVGSERHFRDAVKAYRPARSSEAYLRLRPLPGEQAQVDWALCRSRHSAHYAESRIMPRIETDSGHWSLFTRHSISSSKVDFRLFTRRMRWNKLAINCGPCCAPP